MGQDDLFEEEIVEMIIKYLVDFVKMPFVVTVKSIRYDEYYNHNANTFQFLTPKKRLNIQ
jgi:hypothetical protein